MKLSANGWSHLGLRITNLARAKRFYVDALGCPLVRETEGAVFVTVAGLLIALFGADAHTPGKDHFDPFRVGLDHLALAVEDPSQFADPHHTRGCPRLLQALRLSLACSMTPLPALLDVGPLVQ